MKAYKSSKHCVGESNWHIQLTPAYRRPIFSDKSVQELTVAYLVEAAQRLGIQVSAIECGPDHIHLFMQETRMVSIVEAVQRLKGYSSYMMRKGHHHLFKNYLWGKKFWSSGYFYQTVGVITSETVKQYIERGQKKHWAAANQKTLFSYSH